MQDKDSVSKEFFSFPTQKAELFIFLTVESELICLNWVFMKALMTLGSAGTLALMLSLEFSMDIILC